MFLSDETRIRDGLEVVSRVLGYDSSYQLIYFGSWNTFEEGEWLAIFVKDGLYYELRDSHFVLDESRPTTWRDLDFIDFEEAVEHAREFDRLIESDEV